MKALCISQMIECFRSHGDNVNTLRYKWVKEKTNASVGIYNCLSMSCSDVVGFILFCPSHPWPWPQSFRLDTQMLNMRFHTGCQHAIVKMFWLNIIIIIKKKPKTSLIISRWLRRQQHKCVVTSLPSPDTGGGGEDQHFNFTPPTHNTHPHPATQTHTLTHTHSPSLNFHG